MTRRCATCRNSYNGWGRAISCKIKEGRMWVNHVCGCWISKRSKAIVVVTETYRKWLLYGENR